MLTLEALMALTAKPIISSIDIPLLKDLFEYHLYPYYFVYKLNDGNEVLLRFDKERFCHLIGLENIVKKVTSNPNLLKNYRGQAGWDNIVSGNINIIHMKKLVGKEFNNYKDKLVFFYNIPRLLMDANTVVKYKKIEGSRIECEIIIYSVYDKAYVHLGIEKDSSGNHYFPRSFWMERKTASNDGDRYIVNQNHVSIIEKQKIKRKELEQMV